MGVCQTVGGASTSGQGITGAQVAHAIRFGASLQPDNHTTFHSLESIPAEAFKTEVKRTTQYTPPEGAEKTGDESSPDIHVTSYAPQVFQYLRELEGVTDEQFDKEWDLPPEKTEMKLGEGRSMALFLRSTNMDFMCKTISEVEVNVLMDVLQQYAAHLRSNQNSLLMRFTMLLKVEIKDSIGFILCFGDLFSSCTHLNERWDIKGRIPKPGKYRHFPKHESSEQFHGSPTFLPKKDDQSAFDEDNKNAHRRSVSGSVYGAEDDEKNEPHSPSPRELITRKDKELTRLFWVPEAQRGPLLEQLHADYDFLQAAGLMDYSILIGVKYEHGGDSSMRRRVMPDEGRNPQPEHEARPTSGARGSPAQHISRCEYHNGVSSIGGEETYFIGIIDMLTVYNVKKKSANFFKTFLWEPETLSTIPPPQYKERIAGFTDMIFPPLDPNDNKKQ